MTKESKFRIGMALNNIATIVDYETFEKIAPIMESIEKEILADDDAETEASKSIPNQEAKADNGKLELRLVPTEIIEDIAEVRMYGNKKYGDSENWKTVEKYRYVDALLRHTLLYLTDPQGTDTESGIKHYKHMACNMAFLCAMERKENETDEKAE